MQINCGSWLARGGGGGGVEDKLWERACLRWRSISQHICRLLQRHRRQASSHRGFVGLVGGGLVGVERQQAGGVGGQVLLAFGHGDGLDRSPLIVPTLCVVMHPVTLCVTVAQGVKPGRGASGAAFPRRAWERAGSGVTWGRAAASWWCRWPGLARVRPRGWL